MDLSALTSLPRLGPELKRVDAELRTAVVSKQPFLTEVATHYVAAGGKRLRPALAVVSALAVSGADRPLDEPVSDDVIHAAVAVELVHLGSLYHDDVLDDATSRRTVKSVNAQYGNVVSVLGGDFLLAQASSISSRLGVDIAGVLAGTISELCAGQVGEFVDNFNVERTVEAYETSIAGKTASLLETAARLGAMACGASQSLTDAVAAYGHAFGMAFQIRDDVLDIRDTSEQLGKPAGNDLFEGVYTLPVIYALLESEGPALRELLGAPIDTATRDKARDLIRGSAGMAKAIAVSQDWAGRAITALDDVPDSEIRTMLRDLAQSLSDDIVAAR